MDILDFLSDRLNQLEDRKTAICRYVKQPGEYAGKRRKDFSLACIPGIDEQILETAAAMDGIKRHRARLAGKDSFKVTITSVSKFLKDEKNIPQKG